MMLNNPVSLRERMEQMSTAELDAMLDIELHKEPVDSDAVRMIFSVLREREKENTYEITPEILLKWEKHQNALNALWLSENRRKRMLSIATRILTTAALLTLIIFAIPMHVSAGSIWDILSRFSNNVIEFFAPGDDYNHSLEYQFATDHPGLQQTYLEVQQLGVTIPAVPMWIPEEYVLQECKTMDSRIKSGIIATFHDGVRELVFKVDVYQSNIPRTYQKSDTDAVIFEQYGTDFHIVKNNDVSVAIWTKDNIECSIFIECQEDTLEKILKSIYVMED